MLKQILGYIIAPDGNYISFGDLRPESLKSSFHDIELMKEILKHKWHLLYPELGLTKEEIADEALSENIYYYADKWTHSGFTTILNGNNSERKLTLGFFPTDPSFMHRMTLLLLKDSVLYESGIDSIINIDGVVHSEESIDSIYPKLLEPLFLEQQSYKRKKVKDSITLDESGNSSF